MHSTQTTKASNVLWLP